MIDNMLEQVDPLVWPATVCQVDWGLVEPRVEATISMEGRECEDLVEHIDEVRDPLDQLCFDLAPFSQTKVDNEPDIEFIETTDATREKHVETIDLTDNTPCSPIRSFVKEELRDPLADILAESSDDDEDIYNNDENMMDSLHHNSDLYYTDNERMVQDILDSVIDNLEEYNRRYKEKAYQSAQVLFYSEAAEYIEEKPDVGPVENCDMDNLSIWDNCLDVEGKCRKSNRVDVQNMTLDYEAWSQINKIMRDREMKNKENTGSVNKRIYLEKKKLGEDKNSQRCHDCGIILPSDKALKEHNQTVHDVVTFTARATRYRIVDQTIEITPVREARGKKVSNGGTTVMLSHGTRSTAKKSTTKPPRRCGNCKACTAPDCRKCVYCLDMKKYGGPGTKKQRCMKRPTCFGLQADDKISSLPVGVRAPRVASSPSSNMTNGKVSVNSSSKPGRNSSPISKSAPASRKRTPGSQKSSQNNLMLQSRSPISAARKHLREVENDSEPRLQTRSTVKDELKERLRKRREGEWDRAGRIGRAANKLTSKYKKEAEQRRTVSARKVPLPSRTWPSKEELLFGFPLCDN